MKILYNKTYIYCLEKDNIPFYIGKACNVVNRLSSHRKTYGIDVILYIIDECNNSKNEWKFWECYWIQQFKQWGFELTNQNNGGGGPTQWTKELINSEFNQNRKLKISENNKGKTRNKGKKRSQEFKDNISKLNSGRKSPLKGINRPGFGEQLSKITKGKPKHDKFGEIQSKAKIGKPNLKNRKIILQYDNDILIKQWNSITEAEIFYAGKITGNIGMGLKSGGFRFGYLWKYKND